MEKMKIGSKSEKKMQNHEKINIKFATIAMFLYLTRKMQIQK